MLFQKSGCTRYVDVSITQNSKDASYIGSSKNKTTYYCFH